MLAAVPWHLRLVLSLQDPATASFDPATGAAVLLRRGCHPRLPVPLPRSRRRYSSRANGLGFCRSRLLSSTRMVRALIHQQDGWSALARARLQWIRQDLGLTLHCHENCLEIGQAYMCCLILSIIIGKKRRKNENQF